MSGTITRRCSCRNPETGKNYGKACPKFTSKRHGTYAVRHELPARQDGTRREYRRSGFPTAAKATEELDKVRALLSIPDDDDPAGQMLISDLLESCARSKEPLPGYDETRRRFTTGQPLNAKTTVAEWLDLWLAGRKRLRPTGLKRYELDVRVHLKPHLGEIRLDKLRVHHLDKMFDAINETNIETGEQNAQRRATIEQLRSTSRKGADGRAQRLALQEAIDAMPAFRRITGASTQQHIKATLRAALNVAVAQQAMPNFNPAEHVELDPGAKPKALVWTDERLVHWEATGEKPSPVMVWTPEQTGRFLDFIAEDRLYGLWHLIAFRGLRRGEACGLRWMDLNWADSSLAVATQLVQDGWEIAEGAPKTNSGVRTIALDTESIAYLREQRKLQAGERAQWGNRLEADRAHLHPGGRFLAPPRQGLRPVRALGGRSRPAPGPPPRPAARRRDPHARRRSRHQGRLRHPRALRHPYHPRCLPGRPRRSRPCRGRSRHQADAPGPRQGSQEPSDGAGTPNARHGPAEASASVLRQKS